MNKKFKIGVARRDITPKIGTCLYGYRPNLVSDSIHDLLSVTAFYFSQGSTRALLISCDLCLIPNALNYRIRGIVSEATGIDADHIILHAIHTHTGPTLGGMAGWGDPDFEYIEAKLIPAILEASRDACNNADEAGLCTLFGESLVGINRREMTRDFKMVLGQDPRGSFDPKMTVLCFADNNKKPLCNIIHYGCHPTASGAAHCIGRDWPGVMVDTMERETVSGVTTAFVNGPEGDVGPRLTNKKTTEDRDVRGAMEVGAVAAADAARIYAYPKIYSEPELKVSCKTIELPLKKRISMEEAQVGWAKYKDRKVNIAGAKGGYYKAVLDSYGNGYEEKEFFSYKQTIIALGEVVFISCPFELFSFVGLKTAEFSPFAHTLTLSNSNGSEAYFPSHDQICRGGYEIEVFLVRDVQPFTDDCDVHLIDQTVKHLEELYNKD